MDLADVLILDRLQQVANERYGGHLVILKFTTNWRVGFLTPNDRDDIQALPVGKTFAEAAKGALATAKPPK